MSAAEVVATLRRVALRTLLVGLVRLGAGLFCFLLGWGGGAWGAEGVAVAVEDNWTWLLGDSMAVRMGMVVRAVRVVVHERAVRWLGDGAAVEVLVLIGEVWWDEGWRWRWCWCCSS